MLRSPKLIVLVLVLGTIASDPQCGGTDVLDVDSGDQAGIQDAPPLGVRDSLVFNVRAETSGEQVDADGYVAFITGERGVASGVLPPIGTTIITVPGAEGLYIVELAGVDDNCAVFGQNPREVVARGSTSTTFEVTCVRTIR